MKLSTPLFAFLILSALIISCDSGKKENTLVGESLGRINQVTVFMDKDEYDESIAPVLFDSLVFGRPYEGIFFPPELSLYSRHFPYDLFDKYKNLRNIIFVKKGNPEIRFIADTLAKPQAFVELMGNNPEELENLIRTNADSLLSFFRSKDRDFLIDEFRNDSGKEGTPEMSEVGFSLLIPKDYRLVKSEKDLVWYRADYPSDILNIMVYKAPAKDSMQLQDIIELRDIKLKQHTEGNLEGDYVETEKLYRSFVSDSTETDRYKILTIRSNWSMAIDQMGGPSVIKAYIDKNKKEIWLVDAFIFAPLKHNQSKKRDYLTQIESCFETFKILD